MVREGIRCMVESRDEPGWCGWSKGGGDRQAHSSRVGDRRPDLYRLSRTLPGRDLIASHAHLLLLSSSALDRFCTRRLGQNSLRVLFTIPLYLFFLSSLPSFLSIARLSVSCLPAPVRTPYPRSLLSMFTFSRAKI